MTEPWPAQPGRPESGVSAVIVNYGAAAVLPDCVRSLWAAGVEEVVVVDNGNHHRSSDERSVAALGAAGLTATWVRAGANLGFGRAVNLGARSCRGEFLLVGNPDIVLRVGALAALQSALARAETDVGIAGPRLVNPDGSRYPSARAFPSIVDAIGHGLLGSVWPANPFTRRYQLLDWDHSTRREVDWVSGACFLIRREAWEAVGGFDPRYFMYLEDVDLCWRAGRAGWRVVYEPAAEVMHVQGVSADVHPYRMILAHHRSLWLFAVRSTSGWRRALLPLVSVGLASRAAVASVAKWRDARRANRGRVSGSLG